MLRSISPGQPFTVKGRVIHLQEQKTVNTSGGPFEMLKGQIVHVKGYSRIIFRDVDTYIFENLKWYGTLKWTQKVV